MAGGYENATITQVLSIVVFFATFLSGNHAQSYALDMRKVLQGEVWRFFTAHFIFRNLAQAFVALILLYTCRQFERQMGARKFGAFLLFSFLLTNTLLAAVGLLTMSTGIAVIPAPGLYYVVFSLLIFYQKYIPKLQPTKYHFFGNIHLSEKSWIYLLSSQLFLNEGLSSISVALVGALVGVIYDQNILGCQKLRLPAFIEKIFETIGKTLSFILPLSGQTPRTAIRNPRAGIAGGTATDIPGVNRRVQRNFNDGDNDVPIQMPPPDEESIGALVNLGFERQQAIEALRRTGNNVDAAANILLR